MKCIVGSAPLVDSGMTLVVTASFVDLKFTQGFPASFSLVLNLTISGTTARRPASAS